MVFVLGRTKRPLMPCSEKRARKLLTAKRAVVHRMYPFTIRLKDRTDGALQPVRVKLDPGSKQTGIAVVRESESVDSDTGEVHRRLFVIALLQLNHRGAAISDALKARASLRKGRRARHTRYRPARFNNRPKAKGWLAPSLMHRVDTCVSWVRKIQRVCPITSITQELVKFDMQRMANAEVSGVEYQQGELMGYEVREYLLEKHGRKCAYCGVKHVPLEIEHIVPRSRGGTDRVGNLTLACRKCNVAKGSRPVEEFLAGKPEILKRIKSDMTKPLKDAAAVNATRWRLYTELQATGLPVETGSGSLTKFNRTRLKLPKQHALDALCAGHVDAVVRWHVPTLMVKCTGRGKYKRTTTNKYGFPAATLMKSKTVHGFQTGDICVARVTKGSKQGVYRGRIVVRASGSFGITHNGKKIDNLSYKYFRLLQKNDGYGYGWSQPSLDLDTGDVYLDTRPITALVQLSGTDVGDMRRFIDVCIRGYIHLLRDEIEDYDDLIDTHIDMYDLDLQETHNVISKIIYTMPRIAVTKQGDTRVSHDYPRVIRVSVK